MKNQEQLETFWKNFRIGKPMVYFDCIVYRVARGFAKSVAKDANDKINELGLDLTAIPTTFLSDDTFVVQSSEVEL